ncbi:MAG TPA: PAS domain-containing protein, partial [Acidothermaceae bacterium]|nr:PAS domain-containing protein [Acidothermaceae bacterium]
EYAIFMLDPDGSVATWNSGAHRIKGYSADEIIGRHFSVFYTDEEIGAGKPQRELDQAKAEGRARDEGWRVRKDGSRFWANVVITAVYDKNGRLEGFAKVTRDETERKRVDEQARLLEIFAERDRIANELLATVVRQLFEAVLAMESAAQATSDPNVLQRIQEAIDIVDRALKASRVAVIGMTASGT